MLRETLQASYRLRSNQCLQSRQMRHRWFLQVILKFELQSCQRGSGVVVFASQRLRIDASQISTV